MSLNYGVADFAIHSLTLRREKWLRYTTRTRTAGAYQGPAAFLFRENGTYAEHRAGGAVLDRRRLGGACGGPHLVVYRDALRRHLDVPGLPGVRKIPPLRRHDRPGG